MARRAQRRNAMHARTFIAGFALAAVLVAGCGKKAPLPAADPTDTPVEAPRLAPDSEQILRFNNGAEPETLDPAKMTGNPEHMLAMALFEGLTTYDPKTLAPRPGMAESWEISKDGLTYTFKMRRNVRWSNGNEVTADDFLFSWRRAISPRTAAQYAYQFYYIHGAKAFNKGDINDFTKVGIKAPDKYTMVVTLTAPTAFFLDLTSFQTYMPVHQNTVNTHGDKWTRPKNMVSNGPFLLKEWSSEKRVVLEKNPTYWNASAVRLQKIIAFPYENMDTAYSLFKQGKIDWMRGIPLKKIDEIKRLPEYQVAPWLATYFYRFNVTKPPFNDPRVRRALSMAINRRSLVREIVRGGQIPALGFVPPMTGYEGVSGPAYDPEGARKLLAEAGFASGEAFPKVDLLFNTSESHKQVAEAVVEMWKENLGITVGLYNAEWKVYLEDVTQLNYQIARAGWIGDYTDPNTFLDMFVTDGGNNNTGWSNKEYDRLIEAAACELDADKRRDLFYKAEKILVADELPILPLYFYVKQDLKAAKVEGIYTNVRALHPFQAIYIAETGE
jgi:oligopeptide transport system substrate-binding protein